MTTNPMENAKTNYWQNAERTNGRMAMMGFFALVVNYGLFGWIIPGIFLDELRSFPHFFLRIPVSSSTDDCER